MNAFLDELERELQHASTRRVRLATARLPRPPAMVAVAVVSLVLCIAVVLTATQLQSSRPGSGQTATRPVNPQITASFAAFRRPRTQADRLPAHTTIETFNCSATARSSAVGRSAIQGVESNDQIGCFVDQRTQPAKVSSPANAEIRKLLQQQSKAEAKQMKTVGQVLSHLQRGQSRRLLLPDGLGTIWLIPSGPWLCNLLSSPALLDFPGHSMMTCEPIGEILTHPPLWSSGIWSGYFIAVEPDQITHVTLQFPGGSRATYLRDGVLGACVGLGPYNLAQTTTGSVTPITTSLGAGGQSHRPGNCPRLR